MSEFVRLDPPPTYCFSYGTGACCHDKHFDPSEVMPSAPTPICETQLEKCIFDNGTLTTDKKLVNCQDCLERIHA